MEEKRVIAYIRYDGNKMMISTPYHSSFISELKETFESRRWDPERKEWVLRSSERDKVLGILHRHFSGVIEDNKPPIMTNVETSIDTCEIDSIGQYEPTIDLQVWIDGACLPVNPGGTAAYGLIAKQGNNVILRKAEVVGRGEGMSNNVAEYAGVIALLEWCKSSSINGHVVVHSDSSLVVNQMTGKWKTNKKSKRMLYYPFYQRALKLREELSRRRFDFVWIPREDNTEADQLSVRVIEE